MNMGEKLHEVALKHPHGLVPGGDVELVVHESGYVCRFGFAIQRVRLAGTNDR